jgi:hypothetical protein
MLGAELVLKDEASRSALTQSKSEAGISSSKKIASVLSAGNSAAFTIVAVNFM